MYNKEQYINLKIYFVLLSYYLDLFELIYTVKIAKYKLRYHAVFM